MNLLSPPCRLPTSTGGSYELRENLARMGLPHAYLARVLASSSPGLPSDLVLETFGDVAIARAYFDLHFAEDLWLAQQLRAAPFLSLYEAGLLLPGSTGQEPLPYVALEPVRGWRLAALLDTGDALGRRLPLAFTLNVALTITHGLAYLHGLRSAEGAPLGASYRQLSPRQVFVAHDGLVRLLPPASPWLARPAAQEASSAELACLAPELCRGEPPTPACDLYALGVLLFRMLCGRRLFVRETPYETLRAVWQETPPPLSRLGIQLPPGLEALLIALLQKSPRLRPASATEVADRLAELTGNPASDAASIPHVEPWRLAGEPTAALQASAGFACLREPG